MDTMKGVFDSTYHAGFVSRCSRHKQVSNNKKKTGQFVSALANDETKRLENTIKQ